jgi:hypothetical protein
MLLEIYNVKSEVNLTGGFGGRSWWGMSLGKKSNKT